MTEGPR